MVKRQTLPLRPHRIAEFGDAVIKARDRHPAAVVMQSCDDPCQHPHRVHCQPTIHAGMQVLVGGGDSDFFAQQPSQHGGDGGGIGIVKAGITDHRQIGFQFRRIVLQERHQAGRAAFLLALQKHGDAGWQGAMHRFPRPERLDKGHQLALVVAGSPAPDHWTFGGFLDCRVKRVPVPQRQRIHRLHIVMAVKQQMRAGGGRVGQIMRHHHRMARCVAQAGVESDGFKIGHQPFRRLPARRFVGRVSGDRRDAQQAQQTIKRRWQGRVNLRQNRQKSRAWHGFPVISGTGPADRSMQSPGVQPVAIRSSVASRFTTRYLLTLEKRPGVFTPGPIATWKEGRGFHTPSRATGAALFAE